MSDELGGRTSYGSATKKKSGPTDASKGSGELLDGLRPGYLSKVGLRAEALLKQHGHLHHGVRAHREVET